MNEQQKIRSSAVAGMFYEASSQMLKSNIVDMLKQVDVPELKGLIRAIVSPHAGYIYSGYTAAHAYKILKGQQYDCVIVIGPSHREYFDSISIYSGDAYETPLGKVKINDQVRTEMLIDKNIISSEAGHRSEHSIEVQLPFLQYVLKDFSFIPIIMGDQRRELCNQLSEALVKVCTNRNILLVASSDLSHFHSSHEANILDKRVIDDLKLFDAKIFMDHFESNSFEACGGGPIAVVMQTAKALGANHVHVLHSCNSGDITGDKSGVVGYVSAAFVQAN